MFTAAISHRERDGKIVLDVLYERRSPFNPSEVVAEIVALMRQYRCTRSFELAGQKFFFTIDYYALDMWRGSL
jgi:hypothetical protein